MGLIGALILGVAVTEIFLFQEDRRCGHHRNQAATSFLFVGAQAELFSY